MEAESGPAQHSLALPRESHSQSPIHMVSCLVPTTAAAKPREGEELAQSHTAGSTGVF